MSKRAHNQGAWTKLPRWIGFALLLSACSGSGSCGSSVDPATHGGFGQPCNPAWFLSGPSCDHSGLQCDMGTCVTCGSEHSAPCGLNRCGQPYSGLWEDRQPDGRITCERCGEPGQRACRGSSNPCPGGGVLNNGTGLCQTHATDCIGGLAGQWVVLDANQCAVTTATASGDTEAEARTCATALAASQGLSLAPDGAIATTRTYCIERPLSGRSTVTVEAVSNDGAAACAQGACGVGCRQVTEGACPDE